MGYWKPIKCCCKIVFSALMVCSVFACADSAPGAGEVSGQQTLEKSVVLIRSARQDFDYVTPWQKTTVGTGQGSGFVIAGNRILTNAHNVSNCKYVEVKKQNLPRRYPGRVSFIGHDCDLAVVSVLDESFFADTVPLALGGIPKINTTVQTYGFPLGGRQISITEGVVSRIQVSSYSHTQADFHLVIQTDAAINPGNSGGPVIQNEKVVGVAFQGLREAENIGYMIPTTVIRHFLADIEDGGYDGFGSLGFVPYPGLHNKSYADYLKVPLDQNGIVVVGVMMHSSVEDVLKRGDVLTGIDDYNIDNDGMVHIHDLTLHVSEVVEQKQLGQTVELAFYRDGRLEKATAAVALNRPILDYSRQYDKMPRYKVFAGLTFVAVSRNYLEAWGASWVTDMPDYLKYLFSNSMQLNTDRQRKEYVVISEILPDEINSYGESFEDEVVESINGVSIRSLEDLSGAFAASTDGFCVIKFMGNPAPLIIDYQKAVQRHDEILRKYQVHTEEYLEG